ncbi:MAG: TetR family transcriptional regulator [Microbacterium sp.]
MAERRELIADAGIALIAEQGLRALTHRAIDARLALPAGSTSYYFRTRRELITAIAERLSTRTLGDIASAPLPAGLDARQAARAIAALLDTMAARPDDHLARFALLVDLRDDDELHRMLSDASPVRSQLLTAATAVLDSVGVADPAEHAPDVVVVVDGLLFDRVAGGARADAAATLEAYLTGLPRA